MLLHARAAHPSQHVSVGSSIGSMGGDNVPTKGGNSPPLAHRMKVAAHRQADTLG